MKATGTESFIHIFSAENQPATDFTDYTFDPPARYTSSPRAMAWCWRCRKRHRRENMVVQCFYDGWRFFCKDKNCKRKK